MPSTYCLYYTHLTTHILALNEPQRGVYKPAKKLGYSTNIASMATFIGSGLLHDLTWAVMFRSTKHDYDENGNCVVGRCWYPPNIGKQTAFFLWCGVTVMLEKPMGKLLAPAVQWIMARNIFLPTVVISTLVVITALPFAHWYAGDWIVGQYFHNLSLGLFRVVYNNAAA